MNHGFDEMFVSLAQLTPAQATLFRQIAEQSEPATIAHLSAQLDLHPSSVRETVESLEELGVIRGEKIQSQGRGRPATRYFAVAEPDLVTPETMLNLLTDSFFDLLLSQGTDQLHTALAVGTVMGKRALELMHVPDHHRHAEDFDLASHMNKIMMFMSAFGMAATPSPIDPLAFDLHACPFMGTHTPASLGLAIREGFIRRVLKETGGEGVAVTITADADDPIHCTVTLRPVDQEGQHPMLTVKYFGGAVDAAHCAEENIDPTETLAEAISALEARHPALGPILTVSTFLVDSAPAEHDQRLGDTSVIEVLPPFAGG
ncbi:MoaD/ThiS family protein [Schaalia sp. ZJ1691]|uniref:MoaD/ThiS family protein n=1 Tax=Schaalia sp. ZJ1691 TaxID=2709404 RepID=UPI0013ED9F3F|nr:MoaD/ThiS family protein [Schaalia sp. ZJ1691]